GNNPVGYIDPFGFAGAEEFEGEITREIRDALEANRAGRQRPLSLEEQVDENAGREAKRQDMLQRGLNPDLSYIGPPRPVRRPPTADEMVDHIRKHPISLGAFTPRPEIKSDLPARVTQALCPGQTRTPEELKQARNFFERNRDVARNWWEQRTGRQWPSDSTHDEHPRPLKDGGDPLFIEPGYGGPNAAHSIPKPPDGLTDAQRWGKLGGRPPGT